MFGGRGAGAEVLAAAGEGYGWLLLLLLGSWMWRLDGQGLDGHMLELIVVVVFWWDGDGAAVSEELVPEGGEGEGVVVWVLVCVWEGGWREVEWLVDGVVEGSVVELLVEGVCEGLVGQVDCASFC